MLDLNLTIDDQYLNPDVQMIKIEVYDADQTTNTIDDSQNYKFLGLVSIPLDEVICFNLANKKYKMAKKVKPEFQQRFISPCHLVDNYSALSSYTTQDK